MIKRQIMDDNSNVTPAYQTMRAVALHSYSHRILYASCLLASRGKSIQCRLTLKKLETNNEISTRNKSLDWNLINTSDVPSTDKEWYSQLTPQQPCCWQLTGRVCRTPKGCWQTAGSAAHTSASAWGSVCSSSQHPKLSGGPAHYWHFLQTWHYAHSLVQSLVNMLCFVSGIFHSAVCDCWQYNHSCLPDNYQGCSSFLAVCIFCTAQQLRENK